MIPEGAGFNAPSRMINRVHYITKLEIEMRKSNYDKFPSTKISGYIVSGWQTIIRELQRTNNAYLPFPTLPHPISFKPVI